MSCIYRILKRLADVAVSAVALLLLSPFLLVLVVLIRRGSEGPAVFHQERVGRGMEPFTLYKFRTM